MLIRLRGYGNRYVSSLCACTLYWVPVLLFYCKTEIFTRVLVSRNIADAKFREIKSSRNVEINLSFTDVGKSCHSRDFQYGKYVLMHFAKMNFSRKIPNLQYAILLILKSG